jgi:sugar transferase (PEP-CTERM/EpsH1 system associated)
LATSGAPLVVHIIYALGTGGLENGLVNIINRSPPARFRHAIVCLTESGQFADRITAPGVEVIALHKRPGSDLAVYWRLWRELRRLRPAIVHSRNLAALEAQVASLPLWGVRRVHGEHGRDVNDLDGSNWKYRWLRRVMSLFIHRYIAVSKDLADWLCDSIGLQRERVTQIYNGVDQARFLPRSEEVAGVLPEGFAAAGETVVIGAVGRLAEVKNHGALLQAVALLLQQRPELRRRIRLVLVGDGPLRERLEAQAVAASIDEVAWFAGDRDDVPVLLRAMDIFVLPSLVEGISNTVLEAMATGLPVLAGRTGGNPELVDDGKTGYLLPVSDADAWSAALARLVDEPRERRRLGDAGRAKVQERFDWQVTVASYLEVYDELLEGKAA